MVTMIVDLANAAMMNLTPLPNYPKTLTQAIVTRKLANAMPFFTFIRGGHPVTGPPDLNDYSSKFRGVGVFYG